MTAPPREREAMQKNQMFRWLVAAMLSIALCVWSAYRIGIFSEAGSASPANRRELVPSAAELPDSIDSTPAVVSRFLNTSAKVAYIGSQACAECHPGEHETYLHTNHSRALGDIVPDAEPPDVEFTHQLSGRDYKVYRKDGMLWHRESIRSEVGDDLVLADFPIRYVIGSGAFSRSYLVEDDGFLVESPVTWYAASRQWSMSPGYDRPAHLSFNRSADVGCIGCHAGRLEAANGSRFRVRLLEQSIGCESCHGPGELHAARWQGEQNATQVADDLTIVNPKQLTKEQNEAICAQCHLRGVATVLVRGRNRNDFRPGLRTADVRVEYALERTDRSMKVVGHVEQMRLSKCYQQSDSLTCTICHDPHAPANEKTSDFYRDKCLECHGSEACGLAAPRRLELNQADNCVACHMPQSRTDIPHFAFTHHRIGLHNTADSDEADETVAVGKLIPFDDLSHLPALEQDRCLGLAYLELSDRHAVDESHAVYRRRAHQILESVRQRGLRDGDVDAALARLYWESEEHLGAINLADSALGNRPGSGARTNALLVIGDSYLRLGQLDLARKSLESLVKERRHSEDWLLLAMCRQRQGDVSGAIESLERAVEISGFRADLRRLLAELYDAQGHAALAAKCRQEADVLTSQFRRDPAGAGTVV